MIRKSIIDDSTLLAIAEYQVDVSDGEIHGEAIQVPVLEAPGELLHQSRRTLGEEDPRGPANAPRARLFRPGRPL